MDVQVVSGLCVGFVALLSVMELKWSLPRAEPLTRPRLSADWRCPYCHQAIEDGTERVRCKFCGTKHHAPCWSEHRGCSVFGCGSLEHGPAAERRAKADLAEQPVPEQAPADPVG